MSVPAMEEAGNCREGAPPAWDPSLHQAERGLNMPLRKCIKITCADIRGKPGWDREKPSSSVHWLGQEPRNLSIGT